MVAPTISYWTSSNVSSHTTAFITGSWGLMNTVYDYGTIDTGSSGSTVFFWIANNASGSAQVAHAILTSSGQTYNLAIQLGLGEHASGSADHMSSGTNSWDLQSGSFTGSVWVSSSFYYRTSVGYSGSIVSSGAASNAYINICSGSSTLGSRRLSFNGLVLSGSPDVGTSGSAWLIASYISVPNGIPQGQRTGSFCLKFQYT